ncbi:MAG: 3-alpha domain-containing protein [Terriglobales bacterium]
MLIEGRGTPGTALELCKRPYPQWNIHATANVAYHLGGNRAAVLELSQCPALAASWRTWLARRLRG